jgi:hypothetical protein
MLPLNQGGSQNPISVKKKVIKVMSNVAVKINDYAAGIGQGQFNLP